MTTSEENLQSATDWLWAFKPEASCQMNTASALLKATEDVVGPFIFPIFDLDFRKLEHCAILFWIIFGSSGMKILVISSHSITVRTCGF